MGHALKTPPTPSSSLMLARGGRAIAPTKPLEGRVRTLRPLQQEENGGGASNNRVLHRPIRISLSHFKLFFEIGRDAVAETGPTVPQSRPEHGWSRFQTHLDEWANLPEDWDGEDGRAPSSGVICGAREMIDRLENAGAPIPEIYVAGDGEVGFRWAAGSFYASASFVDDGDVLLYMHKGDEVLHNLDEAWTSEIDLTSFIADLAGLA